MNWISSKWSGRLLPGTLAAMVVVGCLKAGLFQPLDQIGYRLLFALRGSIPADRRVVVIEIDDQSITQLGRFPWPRRQYIPLLDILAQSDSNVVVLDVLFSEASGDDELLAEAMARQGRVVLAAAWNAQNQPLLPMPVLEQNAIAVGHIATRSESDGIVQQVAPLINGLPTLGIAAIQSYRLVGAEVPLPNLEQPLWLNWLGATENFQSYSFVDVIQGRVDPRQFDNKIILIGVTGTGLDPLVTPFDQNPSTGSVYLHATLIHNALQQNFLQPLPQQWIWLGLLLAGPLCSWSIAERGITRQTLGSIGLCGTWGLLCSLLFGQGYLLPLITPIVMLGLAGCTTALYDRIRATRQLQYQIQTMQQSDFLKADFLRTATHELRAPVANMQTTLDLLKHPIGEENWQEYIEILEEECQREMTLVNDLLDLQRLQAGVDLSRLETLNWQDWLQEIATPFFLRAQAKQQTLTLHIAPNLPSLTLDGGSLRRLLVELLNNACKYSPTGAEIKLIAQFDFPHITLEVHNTGTEIPSEHLDKIFEPFYRIPEEQIWQQEGTGLGLAIVKKLAERLQAEIQVSSQPAMTRFTLRLPISSPSVHPRKIS